ncbi:DUF4157 domain-containing protein [Arthrobacter sp. I2-34]|uniref:DUF4157 domain-containing protein n=1 Tax=Arthrobacter hankyongi TaxID=2904801 RepID=A0ABS9L7E8_9MICC|nr:DUF4157 domain-containing protein [Arthrobacter hankyongi]MCG2622417.1 DUF4157 domain-containing protein [Arthrobacter hankyongi]
MAIERVGPERMGPVRRSPVPAQPGSVPHRPVPLQRRLGNQTVMRLAGFHEPEAGAAPAHDPHQDQAEHEPALGPGHVLPEDLRDRLEQAFGTGLGQVRIHHGPEAARLAGLIDARAFAIGRHIGYPAAVSPYTAEGYRLLAHEVGHVLQQRNVAGSPERTNRGDLLELSAQWAAVQAASGRLVGVPAASAGPLLARDGTFRPVDWAESGMDWLGQKAVSAKEAGYKWMIAAIRDLHRSGIGRLRKYGDTLTVTQRSQFEVLVTAVDVIFTILEGLVYAVVGITAGFITGILQMVVGLVQIVLGAAEGILKFLWGFVDGGKAFDEWATRVVRTIAAIPAALGAFVTDWRAKFEKASPEEAALMIGELTGQILAFLATLGISAGKAGSAAQAVKLEARLARVAQAVLEPASAVTTAGVVLPAAAEVTPKAAALASNIVKQGGAAAKAGTVVAAKTKGTVPSVAERLGKLEPRIEALNNEKLYDRLQELKTLHETNPNSGDLAPGLKDLEREVSLAEEAPKAGAGTEPGASTRKTPGRPQPRQMEAGNFAHEWLEELRNELTVDAPPGYEALQQEGKIIPLDEMPNGLQAEVKLGATARADRVGAVIYEVKPNTPASIDAGLIQVDEYVRLANDTKYLGRSDWTGKVVVYDAEAARNFIP